MLLCSHSLTAGTYGLVINKLMDSQNHPGAVAAPLIPAITAHDCEAHRAPTTEALHSRCGGSTAPLHIDLLLNRVATVLHHPDGLNAT